VKLNNLSGPIELHSQISATRTAIAHGRRKITYRELWHEVARYAALFIGIGIKPGDRVAIFLENRPETVIGVLAAAAVGALFVPINPLLKVAQARYVLAHSGAGCIVSSAARLRTLLPALGEEGSGIHVVCIDEPPPGTELGTRLHLTRDCPACDDAVLSSSIDDDAAAILYTSGSTGRPKGVLLSHRSLVQGAFAVASYLRLTGDDRVLCAIPLSFDAGINQVMSTLVCGGTAVLHNYTRAVELARCCEAFAITGMTGVPPFWIDVGEMEWPEAAKTNLRYFASTGGRLPNVTLDRLRRLFGNAKPYLMYGLTEAFRSTYLDPGQVDERPDSIGKAIPNARVTIRRADGNECAPREIGELVHVGACVALGYWNDPEATARRFRPIEAECGGLRRTEIAVWSGDLAWQDEDGFFYFVGRNDAMIKTSGFRVSPTEIEEVALASGLVRETVALGLPDARIGQLIALAVTAAAPGANEQILKDALMRHFRNTAPSYMTPGRILVAQQLPRSPNGKFDRQCCSEMLLRIAHAAGRP